MKKAVTGQGDALRRVVTPLALWALTKVLETRRIAKASEKLDKRVARRVRRARNNAMSNRGWLAAGAAAFALGIGLVARATKKS